MTKKNKRAKPKKPKRPDLQGLILVSTPLVVAVLESVFRSRGLM